MDSLGEHCSAVVALLAAALEANLAVRVAAEAQISAAMACEGFGATVTRVVVSHGEVPYGIRQMGAIVLRTYVRQRWLQDPHHRLVAGSAIQQEAASEAEKSVIRDLLPRGLSDPESRIRTAAGMVIAEVAKAELPDRWPALLPTLTRFVMQGQNEYQVEGALRCLALFVDELDEEATLELARVLLPQLLLLVSSTALHPRLRRKALAMLRSLLVAGETMRPNSTEKMAALWAPHLPALVQVIQSQVGAPLVINDEDDYGCKLQALGCLLRLLAANSTEMAMHVPACLQAAWSLLLDALPVYLRVVVAGEEGGDEARGVDEADGGLYSLETVVSQLMEVLLTVVGSERYAPLVEPHLQQLLYVALGYACMTADQEARWSEDPNQFIADEEDDMSSARVSMEMLVEELVEAYEGAAFDALEQALRARMAESAAARYAGEAHWWRQREACCHVLGCLAHHFCDALEEGEPLPLDGAGLLADFLREDLPLGDAVPFLTGRVLWVAGRLRPLLPVEMVDSVARAAVDSLAPGLPLAQRIGACRAVAKLSQGTAQGVVPYIDRVYAGIGMLLEEAGEDCVHLALEALAPVVAAHPGAAAAMCPQVLPRVLSIWGSHSRDPLLSEDCIDVIDALARLPDCLPHMQASLLPVLVPTLQSHGKAGQSVEAALHLANTLQLLALLLAHAPQHAALALAEPLLPLVLEVVQQCEEPECLQEASECLQIFLHAGGAAVLTVNRWQEGEGVTALVMAVCRLLKRSDHGSATVGRLLVQMLVAIPSQVAPSLPLLMDAAVRAFTAVSPVAQEALLLFFALLLRMSVEQVVGYLAVQQQPGLPCTSLEIVLKAWVERAPYLTAARERKLLAVSAAGLLTCDHAALDLIQVRGTRLDTGDGVRTRRQAAAAGGESWSSVPARAKMLLLLADVLLQAEADAQEMEEPDEGKEHQDGTVQRKAALAMHGGGSSKELQHLAGLGERAEEDEDEGSSSAVPDVAPGQSEPQVVSAALRDLGAHHPALLQQAGAHMSVAQQRVVQRVLHVCL